MIDLTGLRVTTPRIAVFPCAKGTVLGADDTFEKQGLCCECGCTYWSVAWDDIPIGPMSFFGHDLEVLDVVDQLEYLGRPE